MAGLVGLFLGYAVSLDGSSLGEVFIRDPLVLLVVGIVIGGGIAHAYHVLARADARRQDERARYQSNLQSLAAEHDNHGGSFTYRRAADGEPTGVILESVGNTKRQS